MFDREFDDQVYGQYVEERPDNTYMVYNNNGRMHKSYSSRDRAMEAAWEFAREAHFTFDD